MEEEELILRISFVSEYIYCQRNAFYEFYGFEKNYKGSIDVEKGIIAHEAVHEPSIRHRANSKQFTDVNLYCKRLGLRGKADMVEEKNGLIYPVEYKKGKTTDFLNHKVQLCLQAFCLEEMFKNKIESGFLYFSDSAKRKEVIFDDELRSFCENLVEEIKNKLIEGDCKQFKKENNHKCEKCSFYEVCIPEIK